MSYLRLLRLPPQPEAASAARCWRRQLPSRAGSNSYTHDGKDLRGRLRLQHRFPRAGHHVQRSAVGSMTQRVLRVKRREEGAMSAADLVEEPCVAVSRSACTNSAALPTLICFHANPSSRGALLVNSPSARATSPLWGTLDTRSGAGAEGRWSQQQGRWNSLRGFSSLPPEPESKVDSTDSGRRVLPGQRAFLGGLLKPSDVRRLGLQYK